MLELDLPEKHLGHLRALLQTHVPDCEVWAYGSRVTGKGHEGSDLDLVVRQPQALSQPCGLLADLREALQNSPLPILVDVHDWASLPPAFHAEIIATHRVIQTPA
jgi:predicted nucleotidyltransferase